MDISENGQRVNTYSTYQGSDPKICQRDKYGYLRLETLSGKYLNPGVGFHFTWLFAAAQTLTVFCGGYFVHLQLNACK